RISVGGAGIGAGPGPFALENAMNVGEVPPLATVLMNTPRNAPEDEKRTTFAPAMLTTYRFPSGPASRPSGPFRFEPLANVPRKVPLLWSNFRIALPNPGPDGAKSCATRRLPP